MLKIDVNEMREFTYNEIVSKYGLEDVDGFDGIGESGVYKIEFGSREIEKVSEVKVVDGMIEIESRDDILENVILDREYYEEFVDVGLYDGIVEVSLNEEEGYEIVRVERR